MDDPGNGHTSCFQKTLPQCIKGDSEREAKSSNAGLAHDGSATFAEFTAYRAQGLYDQRSEYPEWECVFYLITYNVELDNVFLTSGCFMIDRLPAFKVQRSSVEIWFTQL
eukprot:TRINITY_DN13311_c0_g1_i1.p2 TRINITY_DN13311_c0_g1~~TRINITY_DN13311_c0_g1_i1.p2  ORF type:complete len:110 (-),score=9.71 TRINITY_DN13311_c0_g1_i1:810-1139(-)